MTGLEQQLKKYADSVNIQPHEEKIEETICYAQKAFYEGLHNQRATYMEFLYQQMKYIKKIWWLAQAILLCAFWILLKSANSGLEVQRGMGVIAPSFVIFIIPELWKNRSCGSVEIENTSLYTLRQIYSARMLLFAMVDCLLLLVFSGVAFLSFELEVQQMLIDFFFPMLVTCCICFRMLCSRRMLSEASAMAASVLWIIIWTTIILRESVYHRISLPVWGVLICFAMFYFGYAVTKTLTECKSCWEVTVSWN